MKSQLYSGTIQYPSWAVTDRIVTLFCGCIYPPVTRPNIVTKYNNNMGGVDLADRMISFGRTKARTKKWTIQAMFHFIDLACSNAWLQYRQDCFFAGVTKYKVKQYLQFKMAIGRALLLIESDDSDGEFAVPRSMKFVKVPTPESRTKGMHLHEMSDIPTQMKCRQPGCKMKTYVCCTKCNVFLCLTKARNCYVAFHKAA